MTEERHTQREEVVEAEPVRPLPVRSQGRTLEIWGRQVGPVAVAAAGGAAAGIAVVAVARAARSSRRPPRRGLFRRREKVVASRSFLVDVHVLGR
jgi:negative regulator of sigma E activity